MSEQKQTQEQPGLHPGNMPVRRHGPDSTDPRKTTPDLEDITGNPGHVGINPNAGGSMNPPADPASGVTPSINEPPQPPDTGLPSRPPGELAPTPE